MPSADWRDLLNFNPITDSHDEDAIATVQTLTPPTGATKLLVQAATDEVRFTLENTDPVADTTGFILSPDQPMVIGVQKNTVLKFLANPGTIVYCWGK